MALSVKVGSFAKSTGGAPVSQAVTGVGFVPKVLFLWVTRGITSGTFVVTSESGFGITTGASNSFAVANALDDGVSSDTARRIASKALTVVDVTQTTLSECDLTSFDADGFTLNWTTNEARATLIGYLALGGSDITGQKVIEWAMPTTTGNKAVTGAGFLPSFAMHVNIGGHTTAPSSSTANASFGLGAMVSSAQWATSAFSVATGTNTDSQRASATDAAILAVSSAPAVGVKASYVSFDADGFTVNFTTAPAGASRCISLVLAGPTHALSTFAKSTGGAPASQSVTGTGFLPKAVFLHGIQATSGSPASHYAFGIGATDGSGETACAVYESDGGLPNGDSVNVTTKAYVKVNNTAQTLDAECDTTSLDANGFTLSWTTNDAVATTIFYWAIGAAPAGASGGGLLLRGVGA